MIWIIPALVFAVATVCSFIVFWREDSSSLFARPPVRRVIGAALLWWIIWPGRLHHELRWQWRHRGDRAYRRSLRKFGRG